ncbi:MAG: hypothetical protein K6L73_02890 [Cellvibrionaceae bacterium]
MRSLIKKVLFFRESIFYFSFDAYRVHRGGGDSISASIFVAIIDVFLVVPLLFFFDDLFKFGLLSKDSSHVGIVFIVVPVFFSIFEVYLFNLKGRALQIIQRFDGLSEDDVRRIRCLTILFCGAVILGTSMILSVTGLVKGK